MRRNALGRDAAENELLESFKPPQTLHLAIFFSFPLQFVSLRGLGGARGRKSRRGIKTAGSVNESLCSESDGLRSQPLQKQLTGTRPLDVTIGCICVALTHFSDPELKINRFDA